MGQTVSQLSNPSLYKHKHIHTPHTTNTYCVHVHTFTGPFVSPEEVIARLVQVGLFDKAVDTALQFDLPLDSVFEALASRYMYIL